VKDLAVDEPAPRRSVHDDPAVLGVSLSFFLHIFFSFSNLPTQASLPSAGPPYPQYQPPYPQPQPGTPSQSRPPQLPQSQQPSHLALQQQQNGKPEAQDVPSPPTSSAPVANAAVPNPNPGSAPNSGARPTTRRPNPVHTAAASLETVERALGDLRVSNSGARGHGHGHGHGHARRGNGHGHGGGHVNGGIKAGEIKVPATDFDFQVSNARFDKVALAPKRAGSGSGKGAGDGDKAQEEDQETNASEEGGDGDKVEREQAAYNPQKSFFDSLSSSAHGPSPRATTPSSTNNLQGNSSAEGRRGAGRNRREEERERNVATFGEPGGVGLMGPGAYVGGWGGYGRRGGRPRRGLGVTGEGR
jgi:protein LSM14